MPESSRLLVSSDPMATRFTHSARIDAPVETIFSSLGDEAFWHDRLAVVGTPRDTLDAFEVTDDSITVTTTQHIPDEDIPDIARKVLPGQLVVVRTNVISGFDGERFVGAATADAVGGLGQIEGGSEAVARDGLAEESVSGKVKVSVPLLGGKLEKLVVEHLQRLFASEYEQLNRWVANR